jgi:TfoX/Sxy family transcriptional regulator of competence genes
MPYDEGLAERIRESLEDRRGVTERKMFGGLAFLLRGNMFVGIVGRDLMVRVGPQAHENALSRPHARPMDFTGRPMRGFVFVAAPGYEFDADLRDWVARGVAFADPLQPK